MQCTSAYPTECKDVNLKVLDEYGRRFKGKFQFAFVCNVHVVFQLIPPDIYLGYSGHEIGYIPTLGAIAKGAKVIERHFTLDKTWKGSDHCCSLTPEEFKHMVQDIRVLEQALGCEQKSFLECEKACFAKLGKSVVAATSLPKGHLLERKNLKIKVSQPHGWPAWQVQELIGRSLTQDLNEDDIIDNTVLQ